MDSYLLRLTLPTLAEFIASFKEISIKIFQIVLSHQRRNLELFLIRFSPETQHSRNKSFDSKFAAAIK